jgi:putative hemolysin
MILLALAVVLLLVLLNGVFSMSELAVVSARRARLQTFADRGDKGAKLALAMAEHPTRFLSAVQVGITLIGILAGAYGQATIAGALDKWLEPKPVVGPHSEAIATIIVVIGLTYVSVILGELVPKRLALLFPDAIARRMAPFLAVVATVLRPFVTILTVSTAAILKLMGVRDERTNDMTAEEVETVLAEGADAGLIEPEERSMIQEVLRLGDRPVRVAMTPRRDLFWISLADTPGGDPAEIRGCPYSRIVVATEDDLDGEIGVILKKDLLDACLGGGPIDIAAHVQQPIAIPETMSLLRAMAVFKQTPLHMALVVDEFGSIQGVDHPAGPAGNDRRRLPRGPRRERDPHPAPRGRLVAGRRPPRHPGAQRRPGRGLRGRGRLPHRGRPDPRPPGPHPPRGRDRRAGRLRRRDRRHGRLADRQE